MHNIIPNYDRWIDEHKKSQLMFLLHNKIINFNNFDINSQLY